MEVNFVFRVVVSFMAQGLKGNYLKDNDFKGRSDYVKDVTKNSNICMYSSCEKEQNP